MCTKHCCGSHAAPSQTTTCLGGILFLHQTSALMQGTGRRNQRRHAKACLRKGGGEMQNSPPLQSAPNTNLFLSSSVSVRTQVRPRPASPIKWDNARRVCTVPSGVKGFLRVRRRSLVDEAGAEMICVRAPLRPRARAQVCQFDRHPTAPGSTLGTKAKEFGTRRKRWARDL